MNAEVCTICQDNIHADEAITYLHMNSTNGHHAFHKNCAAQCNREAPVRRAELMRARRLLICSRTRYSTGLALLPLAALRRRPTAEAAVAPSAAVAAP